MNDLRLQALKMMRLESYAELTLSMHGIHDILLEVSLLVDTNVLVKSEMSCYCSYFFIQKPRSPSTTV